MKQTFLLYCSVAIFCLCISCRIQKQPKMTGFFDVKLTPVELNGLTTPTTDDDSRPTLIFNTQKSRIGGYSGCNNFFGDYKLNGNTITFSKTGATKRACIGIGDELERAMLSVLRDTKTIEIHGDTLQLVDNKSVIGKFILLPTETK